MAGESSITSDEFQRFQDQLISLKEEKYRLEEKYESLQRKYLEQENKLLNTEREVVRLNEFKNRTKSSRDIDMLINENEVLRERLTAIESNFKLQTEVLKSECESLISENHRLKSQLETCNSDQPVNDINTNACDTEDEKYQIRSLQIEITKMIKENNNIQQELDKCNMNYTEVKKTGRELSERVDSLLTENKKLNSVITNLMLEKDQLEENTSLQINNLKETHDAEIEAAIEEKNTALYDLKLELVQNFEEEKESLIIEHSKEKEALESSINDIQNEIDLIKELSDKKVQDFEEEIKQLKENNELNLTKITVEYEGKISSLNEDKEKLEEELSFAKEEIKLVEKKNKKLLKDVKKQLEKEVKMTQEAQSKLAEAVIQRGSLTSQNIFSSSGLQLSTCGDDSSSVYSWSNNGILSDSQNGSSTNIPVTDDELKTLLDRVTESQSELGDTKRLILAMEKEKQNLCRTIEKQQKIIHKYIRGQRDSPSTSTSLSTQNANSTTDTLVMNGILSHESPLHSSSSSSSVSSVINRMKESLKTLSNEVLNQTTGPNSISTLETRVTRSEVKQLQRVCEELMMRCLNLESDLQASIDFNVKLQEQIHDTKIAASK